MKETTIQIKEDLKWKLGQLKYTWQVKSLDAVIRRLIEICSKIETAYSFSTNKNPSAGNSSFLPYNSNSASTSHAQKTKQKKGEKEVNENARKRNKS